MQNSNLARPVIVAVIMAVSVFGTQTAGAGAADLMAGKKDFTTYCAPCHGVSGVGDGPVAPELMKKPRNLTMFSQQAGGVFPAAMVRKMVDGRQMPRAHGTPQMPVWGQWFGFQATAGGLLQEDRKTIEKQVSQRLDNLVAYIRTLQKK